MKRTAFAVFHKIQNSISWYGSNYKFKRRKKNSYGEPIEESEVVEVVKGIYHESQQNFIALLNTEAASIKSKSNKGVLCLSSSGDLLAQNDEVEINSVLFKVTAVEPILYGDVKIATEVSLEESVYTEEKDGNET